MQIVTMKIVLIAAGGALGALLRYAVSGAAHSVFGPTFPWGTLTANLFGCFAIGLFWGVAEQAPLPPHWTPFFLVGVLGAFTTFSTFGLETMQLLRENETGLALVNLAASNLGGLLLVYVGFVVARLMTAPSV